MTIPKKIHYCWFGGRPLPEIAIRCIDSWKIHCPDYEIIRWDESNTDFNSCLFVKEAYTARKWAFVSDYIRLKVIEEHGGIYLDIDVELFKPLDPLLEKQGYMGFEHVKPYKVNTGLGFGAIPHHPVIIKLLENYENSSFIKDDGVLDMTPCPQKDTKILVELGLRQDNSRQLVENMDIYPFIFFSPPGEEYVTAESFSLHHYNGSWLSDASKKGAMRKKILIKKYGLTIGSIISLLLRARDDLADKGVAFVINKTINKLLRNS